MGTMTDFSLEVSAKRFNGVTQDPALYIATGSGSTEETNGDTALASENTLNGSARALGTASYVESGDKSKVTVSFTFTGPVTVREFGLFTGASGDNCVYRHVLDADRTYGNGEGIDITIEVPFGRAS